MKSSEFRNITDELLSAYLDNAVTDQERALVEAAVKTEPDIAWRLDSLRQTVQLLNSLPELALPRSFVLQEAHLAEAVSPSSAGLHPVARVSPPASPGFWAGLADGWRALWQSGNPILRNAAAASLVLLLVLVGSVSLLSVQPQTGQVQVATAPAPLAEQAPPEGQQAIALASPPAIDTATDTATDTAATEAQAEQPSAKSAPAVDEAIGETTGETTGETAEAPAPEMAADAGTLAAPEEPGGEAALAQAAAAPMSETEPAQPAITPVAPLPGGFPGAPGARAMGGGGDGMGAGGAGGEMPGYPGDAGGLLPPGAYESAPDFVPAEPPAEGAAQGFAPPTPEESEEAAQIAMIPPAEPTAVPTEEAAATLTDSVTAAVTAAVTAEESAAAEETVSETAVVESPLSGAPEATATVSQVGYGIEVTRSGLLRMAQVGLGLITLMLLTLWWRSRDEAASK